MARHLRYDTYSKLSEDGVPDFEALEQPDYNSVVDFLKASFPNTTRVQRDMDSTLKRRFVFGRQEKRKPSVFKHYSRRPRNEPRSSSTLRCLNLTPRKLKYGSFVELHELWKAYVTNALEKESKIPEIQVKLSRIDMHGALITVAESKCKSLLGIKGIVIKETKNTFLLVTEMNEVKRIPKADTVFHVMIPEPAGIMEVVGNNFVSRPAERSCRKIKSFVEKVTAKTNRKLVIARTKKR